MNHPRSHTLQQWIPQQQVFTVVASDIDMNIDPGDYVLTDNGLVLDQYCQFIPTCYNEAMLLSDSVDEANQAILIMKRNER